MPKLLFHTLAWFTIANVSFITGAVVRTFNVGTIRIYVTHSIAAFAFIYIWLESNEKKSMLAKIPWMIYAWESN